MRNVKVKPSALYQFDLPIDVKCGTIGKLKINISWTNILNKPAVAEIEDLFVLLGPFEDKINDPVKIDEMDLAYKKKQLQEVEKIDKTEILGKKIPHLIYFLLFLNLFQNIITRKQRERLHRKSHGHHHK